MSRKLALAISCIPEDDREWILGELSDSERKSLNPLLVEIRELGLDKDKSVVDAVLSDLFGDERPVPDAVKIQFVDKLPNLDPFWQSVFIRGLDSGQQNFIDKTYGSSLDNLIDFERLPKKFLNSFYGAIAKDGHV